MNTASLPSLKSVAEVSVLNCAADPNPSEKQPAGDGTEGSVAVTMHSEEIVLNIFNEEA